MFKRKKFSLLVIFLAIMVLFTACEDIEQILTSDNNQLSNAVEDNIIPEDNLDELENDNENLVIDREGNLQVHVIDVGQGSSTFIVGADGKTMLYDAGGDNNGSGRIIVDYIKNAGYEHIDVAIFTHPHADHINGAPAVFEELEVGSVYYPKVTHTTKTFERFVDAVREAGLKFKTAKAGVEIPFGETNLVLLSPISEKYKDLNDYSATAKLTWKGSSVLLTGDSEKISENEMVESGEDLNVDLLLVPHHGSSTSSTDEFLNKTRPDYAIISSAKDNSYGHPHKEVVNRLNERNIKFYNTAESGTVVAILDGEKIYINTEINIDEELEKNINEEK